MTDKEEIKDGLLEEFHDNGQLKYRGNYKYGKRNGSWEEFHENGNLHQKGNYKNGKRDGLWEVFYFISNNNPFVLHGQLMYRGNYENGQLKKTRVYKNPRTKETLELKTEN